MCEKYDKNDKLDLTTAKIILKNSCKILGLLAVHIIEFEMYNWMIERDIYWKNMNGKISFHVM